MSEQAIERKELALVPPALALDRSTNGKRVDYPTRRVREAIRLMIDSGAELDQAASQVGLTTRALRLAFEKPSVREHVKRQLDVFRAAVNAKNIFRLAQIRDAADNMPAVNAIKELRADESVSISQSGNKQTAGIVINIVSGIVNPQLANDPPAIVTIPNSPIEGVEGEK